MIRWIGQRDEEGQPLEYIGGVPARDLTEAEFEALTDRQKRAVRTTGLYDIDAPDGEDAPDPPDESGFTRSSVINALGPELGRLLIDAGFATGGAVAEASDEELLAIDGIAEARLVKIREQFAPAGYSEGGE